MIPLASASEKRLSKPPTLTSYTPNCSIWKTRKNVPRSKEQFQCHWLYLLISPTGTSKPKKPILVSRFMTQRAYSRCYPVKVARSFCCPIRTNKGGPLTLVAKSTRRFPDERVVFRPASVCALCFFVTSAIVHILHGPSARVQARACVSGHQQPEGRRRRVLLRQCRAQNGESDVVDERGAAVTNGTRTTEKCVGRPASDASSLSSTTLRCLITLGHAAPKKCDGRQEALAGGQTSEGDAPPFLSIRQP